MTDPSHLNDYNKFIFFAYFITLFSLIILFIYTWIRLKIVKILFDKYHNMRKT